MMITGRYGHNAHSDDLRAMLGLPPKAKLPAAGLPPRYIQGIKVWVVAVSPGLRRKPHRVLAECPTCHQVLSAGRLHQHRCPR